MFEQLTQGLNSIFDKIRGRVVSENDIKEAMREVRVALLEADVSLPVVKAFISSVSEKALGADVVKSVSPAQMIIKIVHDHLKELLGSSTPELNLSNTPPVTMMMVGLQGSGKTTSSAKLAHWVRKHHDKKVLLASLDVYRPAAQEQLAVLAKENNLDALSIVSHETPQQITTRALKEGKLGAYDIVILDTAGRLHIDEPLMQELKEIKAIAHPAEIMLVVDALTGQDALHIAEHFQENLSLTGAIFTRLDGDARGGATLSMRQTTNTPIKFVGVGEKVSEFELFHPDRIASRILDMGDVVSLVEKAVENVEQADAEKMLKRLKKGKFDLNDLLSQLRTMKKMGGFGSLLGLMPGVGKMKKQLEGVVSDKEFTYQEAIILSMTKQERKFPKLLNASRKRRIASGAGVDVQHINKLLKQFQQMQFMMKKFLKMDKGSMRQLEQQMKQNPMLEQLGGAMGLDDVAGALNLSPSDLSKLGDMKSLFGKK